MARIGDMEHHSYPEAPAHVERHFVQQLSGRHGVEYRVVLQVSSTVTATVGWYAHEATALRHVLRRRISEVAVVPAVSLDLAPLPRLLAAGYRESSPL